MKYLHLQLSDDKPISVWEILQGELYIKEWNFRITVKPKIQPTFEYNPHIELSKAIYNLPTLAK